MGYMKNKKFVLGGYPTNYRGLLVERKQRIASKSNLTGKVFERLHVVEEIGLTPDGWTLWGCLCDCGKKTGVRSRELLAGHTRSCGCLHRESLKGGRNKLPEGHASRNELLASYVKSAAVRGHAWGLQPEEFFTLVSGPCSYCGAGPDRVRKPNIGVNGGFVYTGVDRIDSTVGYSLSNCVSCCWDCNRAKGTMSESAFRLWISRLASFQSAKSARFEHGESGARK